MKLIKLTCLYICVLCVTGSDYYPLGNREFSTIQRYIFWNIWPPSFTIAHKNSYTVVELLWLMITRSFVKQINVLLYRNISRSADTPTAQNMQVYEQTISSINPVLFPLPLCSCALYGYINMFLHNLVQFMYPSQRRTLI